ncbi:hypothetical protein [Staphylococcus aureus]
MCVVKIKKKGMFIVIYNKQGDQLLKISEAVKIAKKKRGDTIEF